MAEPHVHAGVARVTARLHELGQDVEIRELNDSARSAREAAEALGVDVAQIASSIVFTLTIGGSIEPLLVITSGKHRVDTNLISRLIPEGVIGRADADFVRLWSGFAIGGVSPTGWVHDGSDFVPRAFVDSSLAEFHDAWAAAGHTHVVYRTNFTDLVTATSGTPAQVAHD